MHLVDRESELHAVVGHALVDAHDILELADIAALARVGLAYALLMRFGQAAQTAGMVFLERGALLQETGVVLAVHMSMRSPYKVLRRERVDFHTLAEATLCFRRARRVLIPI